MADIPMDPPGRVSVFDPVPSQLPRTMLTGHSDFGMFKMTFCHDEKRGPMVPGCFLGDFVGDDIRRGKNT